MAKKKRKTPLRSDGSFVLDGKGAYTSIDSKYYGKKRKKRKNETKTIQ